MIATIARWFAFIVIAVLLIRIIVDHLGLFLLAVVLFASARMLWALR